MSETTGDRLYRIRLACGDGLRRAEPLPEFVARVKAATGQDYHEATVSLLERMKQAWRLRDLDAFAAVDPLNRGAAWLAWGESPPAEVAPPEEPPHRAEFAVRPHAHPVDEPSTKPKRKRGNDR